MPLQAEASSSQGKGPICSPAVRVSPDRGRQILRSNPCPECIQVAGEVGVLLAIAEGALS